MNARKLLGIASIIGVAAACRPTGPGLGNTDDLDAGPFTTELNCPSPGSLPFLPADRDWRVEDNENEVSNQPRIKHQPADVMTTPTTGAAYTDVPGDSPLVDGNLLVRGVMARIENDRGLVGDVIADEHMSAWQYSEAGGWEQLGAQITDTFDTSTPGAFSIDTGSSSIGVDNVVRYSVLNPEGTCGTHQVFELAAGRQVVISDIDATLTASDEEILLQIPDHTHDPARMMASVEMTNAWADKGYQLIYLTARPHVFRSETRFWLKKHGYPDGPMITASDFVFDESARVYKRGWVGRVINDLQWDVVAAYGNAVSDIDAYEDAGIDKATTFIIGPQAGAAGTVAIANQDYTAHIADYVMQQPDANHL